MNENVHIVAVGARTPVGKTAESTAAAVRAGISRIVMHPFFIDRSGEPIRTAMDSQLDVLLMGPQRLIEFARSPINEVLEKLNLVQQKDRGPIAVDVWLGQPEHRPGWTAADSEQFSRSVQQIIEEDFRMLELRFQPALSGHASSLSGICCAVERLSSGESQLCVVGGVESYLVAETLDWLFENKQLACEEVRGGFFPGEGGAFVALASETTLLQFGLSSLGEIVGAHRATETALIKTDDDNLGIALTTAVEGATRNLVLPAEAADAIYCDINGERYRSEEWGFVALRLPHACRDATDYIAPAASVGDIGAASGALFVSLAVESWRRKYARGPRCLLWAGSEAGMRAAVVVTQVAEARQRNAADQH